MRFLVRVVFFLMLVGVLCGCASAETIDSYSNTNADSISSFSANDAGAGQTFTPNANYDLETVTFDIAWSGSNLFDAQAFLFESSGTSGTDGIPNTTDLTQAIASSNVVAASTFSTTSGPVAFTFPPTRIIATKSYSVLVVQKNRNSGAALVVSRDASSPTHAGNFFYRNNGGTTAWTYNGYDCIFSIDGTYISPAEIILTTSKTDPTSITNNNESFSATSNNVGTWTWYIDDVLVQTDSDTTSSTYTGSRSEEGTYNISVFVTDGTSTDSKTWTWIVIDHYSYYVSTEGNNSNAGTSLETPWNTLTYAVQHVLPGGIIYVLPGTYNEVRPMCGVSGTAEAPITITKYNGTVLICGTDTLLGNGYNWAFDLNSKDYWVLDNLSFDTYFTGIQARTTRGTVIKNCNFSYTNHSAISMTGTHDALIENNSFYRCDWNSIGMGNTSYPPYVGCLNITIRNNTISDAMTHSSIDMMGNFSNINIINNRISNTPCNAIYTHQTVLSGALGSGLLLVRNNKFSNCSAIPIYFDDPTNNSIIAGNVFSEIHLPTGGYSWIKSSDPCTNITFLDNILIGSDSNYLTNLNIINSVLSNNTISNTGSGVEYYIHGTSTNNIISGARTYGKTKYKVKVYSGVAENKFSSGRVFTSSTGVVSYTAAGSTYTQNSGTTEYTMYNYSALPVTGSATITPHTPTSLELANFTTSSTNGNSVLFTVWELTPGNYYKVNQDGTQLSQLKADADGEISWSNSAWSEHTYTVEEGDAATPSTLAQIYWWLRSFLWW